MNKRTKSGFTLIEMLVAIAVIVLLIIGIGAGVNAGLKAYKESIFESNCGTLSEILNTTIGDALRYSEDVSGENSSFTFTNYDYNVKACYFTIKDIDNRSGGYVYMTNGVTGEKAINVPIVNDGAYADDLMVTSLVITSHKSDNGGYYFDIAYTITSISDSNLSHDYTLRVRQANADVQYVIDINSGSDTPGGSEGGGGGDSPTVDAESITIVYDSNVPNDVNDRFVFTDVFGNKTRSVTQVMDPKVSTTFRTFSADKASCSWYELTSWKDDAGHVYLPGSDATLEEAEITRINSQEDGTLTLYAQWSPATYTIIYDNNGGSGSKTQTFTKADKTVTLYSNNSSVYDEKITNSGHEVTFIGNSGTVEGKDTHKITAQCELLKWTAGGTEYSLGQTLTIADGFITGFDPKVKEITLSAKWSSAKVTMPTPKKKSWNFTCWSTKEFAKSGTKNGAVIEVSADTTYYAQWNRTISFCNNFNEKDKTNYSTTTYYYGGTDVSIPDGTPTREGYTFDGWYTGRTTADVKAKESNLMRLIKEKNVGYFYAVWKGNTCTIIYDGKGAGESYSQTYTYGDQVNLSANKFTKSEHYVFYTTSYNSSTKSVTSSVINYNFPDANTVGNYQFRGWMTENGVLYTAGINEGKYYTTPDFAASGSTTLKVAWGTDSSGKQERTPVVPFPSTSESYPWASTWKLEGWSDDNKAQEVLKDSNGKVRTGKLLGGTTYIYAVLSRTVEYYDENDTLIATKKYYSNQSIPAILAGNNVSGKETGYDFNGWYANSGRIGDPITSLSSAPYSTDGALKLYGSWKAKEYTITYNGNGASVSTSSAPATYGTPVTIANNTVAPTFTVTFNKNGGTCGTSNGKASWKFLGWSKSKNATEATYLAGISYDNLSSDGSNVTLYAVWDKSATVTLPSASMSGWTFVGWTTSANKNTGNVLSGSTYTPTANITLYASYKCTVKFDANGGNSDSEMTCFYGETYKTASEPSKDGNIFKGWGTSKLAAGASFTPTPTNGSITYVAQWAKVYKVTLDITYKDTAFTYTLKIKKPGSSDFTTLASYTCNNDDSDVKDKVFLVEQDSVLYYESKTDIDEVTFGGKDWAANDKKTISSDVQIKVVGHKEGCIAKGTLITMADGSQKAIEDINMFDVVSSYSFYNGAVSENYVISIEKTKSTAYTELVVSLSDGNKITIANSHSLFDMNRRCYFEIDSDNYKDQIGKYIMVFDSGKISKAKITSISCAEKIGDYYSIITSRDYNVIAENMLTVNPVVTDTTLFEVDSTYKYDSEKMAKDITRYGLYSYSDWSDYCTEDMFDAFNAKYFKPAVEKGLISIDEIIEWLTASLSNSKIENVLK